MSTTVIAYVFNNKLIRIGNSAVIGYSVRNNQYVTYTDGTCIYRKGVRNCTFVLDIALTETGFDGEEDVDWEQLNAISKPT